MFLFTITLLFGCFARISSTIVSSAGPCQRPSTCPTLYKFLQERVDDYGRVLLLNLLDCSGPDGDIYLRCPNSDSVKQFLKKVQLLPSEENCGRPALGSKIEEGQTTNLKDFPWTALLRYKTSSNGFKYGCNGSLINKRYVLTAAHCIDAEIMRQQSLESLWSIVLGEYHILNKTDCVESVCTEGITEILVKKSLVHPEYNNTTRTADIALIRMEEDVTMSPFIDPICLPPRNLLIQENKTMWVAGWGADSTGAINTIKMKAALKKLNRERCSNLEYKLTEKHLCTGSEAKAQTCPGDSGSSLMTYRPSKTEQKYFIAGVLSTGTRCPNGIKFSVFTEVSPYLEWIIENLS